VSESPNSYWLEDFEALPTVTTMHRTITEPDLVSFITLGGFFEDVFMSREVAEQSLFKGRVVPGLFVVVIAEGLYILAGATSHAVALLGLSDLEFDAPTLCGDTVWAEVETEKVRRTSRGDRGVVHAYHTVRKSDGTVVARYRTKRFVLSRCPEPVAAGQ